MIRKLKSGEYRLYSRKKNPKTGKRRNAPSPAGRGRRNTSALFSSINIVEEDQYGQHKTKVSGTPQY